MDKNIQLIGEIADEKFLEKLSKMIGNRLAKERKKIGARKCVHCGKTPRPRFLIGSNSCDY